MLPGYEESVFTAPVADGREVSHDIYQKGTGPVLVIVQELPGIGLETLKLADAFVDAGFRVVLPHLFGPLGRTSMLSNTVRVFCLRREFHLFASRRTSPVVDWLRALCRDVRDRHGVDGVGVIGMCLTGNFAISLMADNAVLAAVASQPSLPMHSQGALHMSPDDVAAIRARLDQTGPMMALRFQRDILCRRAKFEANDAAFNDDKERVRLRTLPGPGHSVLTLDFVDEAGHPTRAARDEVIAYFRQALAG